MFRKDIEIIAIDTLESETIFAMLRSSIEVPTTIVSLEVPRTITNDQVATRSCFLEKSTTLKSLNKPATILHQKMLTTKENMQTEMKCYTEADIPIKSILRRPTTKFIDITIKPTLNNRDFRRKIVFICFTSSQGTKASVAKKSLPGSTMSQPSSISPAKISSSPSLMPSPRTYQHCILPKLRLLLHFCKGLFHKVGNR